MDAEIRPRFEYRHGFGTLFPDGVRPATFVSQRTRLNTMFNKDRLKFYLSLQDVRVWGDVPQLNTMDKNGIGLHQAWGEIKWSNFASLKVGRQEISYDDQRIFGNVAWAQQARSHDIAVIKYSMDQLKFDLGFAFNQDSEKKTGTSLNTSGTYKSMQYGWFHRDWTHFSASLLFLNNGLQVKDSVETKNNKTKYSQTFGGHFNYKIKKLAIMSNLYYQFGHDVDENDLNAYLFALESNYQFSGRVNTTLGAELISGNNNGTPSDGNNNAFTPFYGTNHKFNGLMDYFFVGNHQNDVGLWDVYGKSNVIIGSNSIFVIAAHYFAAAADISGTDSKQLGMELDLVYSFVLDKNIQFHAGYSHLFSSHGMELVKGNADGNTNNWAWLMITLTPILFENEK